MPQIFFLLLVLPLSAFCQTNEIFLWATAPAGSEGKEHTEKIELTPAGERRVSSVHRPSITPYLATNDGSSGIAVLILPGGAHRFLSIDQEGYNVAQWFKERGISGFVLKYRLARETNSTYSIENHSLLDVQRAIRTIRLRAKEWGLHPKAIGVLGFSAGGELASMAAMAQAPGNSDAIDPVEQLSGRPDFQALIYPGQTGKIQPSSNSPPAFLSCSFDDRPEIAEGIAEAYLRFKKVSVPAELHIYSKGGHGYGFRSSSKAPHNRWIERFADWLAASGFVNPP